MLYVVEIRRERQELSTIMARIREWLDRQRFEPDVFRCSTNEETVTCRVEFKLESHSMRGSLWRRGKLDAGQIGPVVQFFSAQRSG